MSKNTVPILLPNVNSKPNITGQTGFVALYFNAYALKQQNNSGVESDVVLDRKLDGFNAIPYTPITSTDSVLIALEKIQHYITNLSVYEKYTTSGHLDDNTKALILVRSDGTEISIDFSYIYDSFSDIATDISNLQSSKLDKNTAITGATHTKITYDSNGLVTSGADATTADIADTTDRRYVTDAQKTKIDNSQTYSNLVTAFQVIPDHSHYPSEKLVKDYLDEKADLIGGKIPAQQLPSNVYDVIYISSFSATDPISGSNGDLYYNTVSKKILTYNAGLDVWENPTTPSDIKLYVNKAENLVYRWDGANMVAMSSPLVLGETDTTAYRGDRGKAAYDHSLINPGNPHGTTKTDVGLGNVPNTDTTNPANITQDSTHRFVTDTEKSTWNAKQDALGFTPENVSNKQNNLNTDGTGVKYPTVDAVNSALSNFKASAGLLTAPTYVDNNNGTFTINANTVSIWDNSLFNGYPKVYSVSQATTNTNGSPSYLQLQDNTTNYIVVNYNSGTPRYEVVTDVSVITESDIIPVATIYRSGNNLHNLMWDAFGTGLANKLNQRLVKTQRIVRESGLTLSTASNTGQDTGGYGDNIVVSDGYTWNGGHRQYVDACTSSGANVTTFLCYQSGSLGTWVISTAPIGFINTQYWDSASIGLQSLSSGKYTNCYIYRGIEDYKHIYIVLGEGGQYSNIGQATAEPAPASLPNLITSHAILIGRITAKQGTKASQLTVSAFAQVLGLQTTTDHESLSGLLGGGASDHQHLTSAQLTVVQNTSNTNTGDETTDRIATIIHNSTSKTPLVDADEFEIADSEDTYKGKKALWSSIKSTLKTYFDGLYQAAGSAGDMFLASVQSVTGLKTFDKDKFAMKGSSTGVTTISNANASITNYTQILPAQDGTFAMLTDLPIDPLTIGVDTKENTGVPWDERKKFKINIVPTTASSKAWTRSSATITVTSVAHGLTTGSTIAVTVSSDTGAIPLGNYSITKTGADTFTFVGVNTGGVSGTITYTTCLVSLSLVSPYTSFAYYIADKKFTVTATEIGAYSIGKVGVEGTWFYYIQNTTTSVSAPVMALTQTAWNIYDPDILLWNFHYNATANTITWIGEERHTAGRDIFQHARNHAQGAIYGSGLIASAMSQTTLTSNNDNCYARGQFWIGNGSFFDEDIRNSIINLRNAATRDSSVTSPNTDWALSVNQYLGFQDAAQTGTTTTSIVFSSSVAVTAGQPVTVFTSAGVLRGNTTITNTGEGTTHTVSTVASMVATDLIVVGARIPIYYISAVAGTNYTWRRLITGDFLGVSITTSLPFTTANVASQNAAYNNVSTGGFSSVTSGRYYPVFLCATNSTSEPIIAILGQNQSTNATLNTALSEAAFNFNNLVGLSGLGIQEVVPFYRAVFEYNGGASFNVCRMRLRDLTFINTRVSTSSSIVTGGTVTSLTASQITVDTTNFTSNLSSANGTAQSCFDTIDDMVASSNIPNVITSATYDAYSRCLTMVEDLGGALTLERRYRYYSGGTNQDGSIDIMEVKDGKANVWKRVTYNYTAGLLTSTTHADIAAWTI